jgi:hypothetical protein
MLLIFPEGAFQELLPEALLQCEGEYARFVEWNLRARIYTFDHFQDDSVIEAEWVETAQIEDSGWGVQVERHPSSELRGAWSFKPIIHTSADLKMLHFPT